jgi:hypothetical protein
MNEKIFQNMSLYTLASFFIDSYSDYENRIINNRKLNNQILDYIINDRKDEDFFFPMVESMNKIRQGK